MLEYLITYLFLLYFPVLQNSATGEVRTLRDFHTVASLQDQAQMTLSKYIQTSYPSQPFRFGKLLLLLPTLKSVSGNTIEELFFRKTIGSIPIERLLIDMFKSNDLWGPAMDRKMALCGSFKKETISWKRCCQRQWQWSNRPQGPRGQSLGAESVEDGRDMYASQWTKNMCANYRISMTERMAKQSKNNLCGDL